METPKTAEVAHIGRSVVIKGELSGSEDLYVDGQVEGTIELHGNSLTVGPNGRLRADVNARNVIIHGTLEGNVKVSERTDLRKSAVVTGDISSQKIAIEDGAYFKGKVDIQKEAAKPSAPTAAGKFEAPISERSAPEAKVPEPAASAVAVTSAGPNRTQPSNTPVTEPKKF
ncbi:MAG: bactofilin family protein [Terriglobales bacterium]